MLKNDLFTHMNIRIGRIDSGNKSITVMKLIFIRTPDRLNGLYATKMKENVQIVYRRSGGEPKCNFIAGQWLDETTNQS